MTGHSYRTLMRKGRDMVVVSTTPYFGSPFECESVVFNLGKRKGPAKSYVDRLQSLTLTDEREGQRSDLFDFQMHAIKVREMLSRGYQPLGTEYVFLFT